MSQMIRRFESIPWVCRLSTQDLLQPQFPFRRVRRDHGICRSRFRDRLQRRGLQLRIICTVTFVDQVEAVVRSIA